MSIQFLGMIGHRLSSETIAPVGPIFDRDYIVRFAQTHEAAGFDRLLVGHWSDQPDGFLVTALAGLSTQHIGFLLAHRPGFVSPTLAARKFATLEHLLGGRLAVHIISGGNDAEQRRDGDYLDHDQRYARTDAFLETVRKVWTAEQPVDIANDFYQAEQAWSAIRPLQKPHIPSTSAVPRKRPSPWPVNMPTFSPCGGSRWRKPRKPSSACGPRRRNISVKSALASRSGRLSPPAKPRPGRKPSISCTSPPSGRRRAGAVSKPSPTASGRSVCGPRRRRARWWINACGPGSRSWVGGGHNSTALVGTPEQVADALLDYYDLGVRNFLIRGFDPLNDAQEYGKALLPITREKAALRAVAERAS
ncbi:putative lavin-dependent oxidoreductase [Klebsiella grimontii]|nr:putative lavin-dependent oxidoreductase [Klebsiella grimontii]